MATVKNAKRTSDNKILNNCVKILNVAIKRKKSAKAACESLGFGKNYISDVKLTLENKILIGSFTKAEAIEFARLYTEYQRVYNA